MPLKIKMWCFYMELEKDLIYIHVYGITGLWLGLCVDAVVHVEVSELKLSLNFSQYIVLSLIYFTHTIPDLDFKREKKKSNVWFDFHTLHEHRLIDISQ